MRKKYLSALLFGALLVTSAGTFTSCKDYDDDINNLQEQINTIKTDLASLTETVNNLDGVKTLSFSNGTLVIETGKGTKVEVPVPSATGVTEVKLEGNVLYVNGEEAGKVEVGESEIVKVEVKEDGKLYINDVAQELEIGSKIVMVDNGNYYTMTIDGKESYNLPKYNAAAAITSIEVDGNFTALGSTDGINWAKAAKNDDWKGSLGKIAANQFLIGQIAQVQVDIQPLSFDLESAKLRLVDSEGKEAPVTVKATALNAEGPITSGSRAADAQGKYLLSIEMKDDVTADNIDEIFTYKGSNVAYALEVDGAVVTPYQTVIKTSQNATTAASTPTISISNNTTTPNGTVLYNGKYLYDDSEFEAGKSYTFTCIDAEACDAYIEYATDADKVKAEQWGFSIEGTTLKTTEKAANGEINIKLHVLGVSGKEGTALTYNVDFNASEAGESQVVTVSPTTYKLDAATNVTGQTINIDINVADVMKNLSIDEVTKITYLSVSEVANQTGFLLDNVSAKYYKAKSDGKIDTDNAVNVVAANGNIRDIAYVRLSAAYSNVASDANVGEYKLELKLKQGADGNEVKKIVMPINITLPTFNELYTRTDQWTGDTYSAILLAGKTFNYSFAFNKAKDNAGYAYDKLAVTFKNGDKAISSNGTLTSAGVATFNNTENDLIKDGKLNATKLTTTFTYKFFGKDNFKVQSTFTTELHSIFEEPKLVYYVNGVAQDKAVLGADNKIALLTVNNNVKNGLAIQYGRDEKTFAAGNTIDGVTIQGSSATPTNKIVKTELSIKNNASASATWYPYDVTITSGVTSGTLVVKFTDANGIVTETSINFE